jgi:hypothetical protein
LLLLLLLFLDEATEGVGDADRVFLDLTDDEDDLIELLRAHLPPLKTV